MQDLETTTYPHYGIILIEICQLKKSGSQDALCINIEALLLIQFALT